MPSSAFIRLTYASNIFAVALIVGPLGVDRPSMRGIERNGQGRERPITRLIRPLIDHPTVEPPHATPQHHELEAVRGEILKQMALRILATCVGVQIVQL